MPSSEKFISEAIQPVPGSFDVAGMTAGEPGLPQEFAWRGRRFKVEKVVRQWRETGDCTHGSLEKYVRKHWFEVVADSGQKMKLYFERKARKGSVHARWWLFSCEDPSETD